MPPRVSELGSGSRLVDPRADELVRYCTEHGSSGHAFNGTVKGVLLAIADDPANSDRMVTAEDAIRVALARQ